MLKGDFVGLDLGSTLVKAVRFTPRGRVLATARRRVRVDRPQPGWVERDAEATWFAAAACLREVSRGGQVAAVGVSGCGNGGVFLDSKGKCLRPGILSSDTRAAALTPARTATGIGYPGQLPVLLDWMDEHDRACATKLVHVLFWKDFIRYKLTGSLATDDTDVGAAGWSRSLNDPRLPPIKSAVEVGGHVSDDAARRVGLPAGTPVAVGCIDCEAAALGSGIGTGGDISMVAGTWAINQVYRSHGARPGKVFLCNPSAEAGRWLWLEGSPHSAANLDWAAQNWFPHLPLANVIARAAKSESAGAFFVPRVQQEKGAFFGLGQRHGPVHLIRAVMEGIAFSHRVQVERLGVDVKSGVRLSGGATRSRFWCQLFSDILQRPVEVPRGDEIGALGAALTAGVLVGMWPSLEIAQNETVRVARRFEPRRSYENSYSHYMQHEKTID